MSARRKTFAVRALMARLLDFEGKCQVCGGKFGGAHGAVEWDHIIPLAMGGEDALENLQPLHGPCHKGKTSGDAGKIAKARRLDASRAGIRRESRSALPGGKRHPFKKRIDGTVVRREP